MALGRSILFALIGCLLGAASLSAQSGTVTGRVLEGTSQEPLAGAAVTAGGRSTVSDTEGRFSLSGVPAGAQTVQASRIGYATARQQVNVTAGGTANVTLALSSSALLLEEVVAIGYGTEEERDVTGSVDVVTSEEFNTGRVVSPEQLIQGKVAGVQVVDNNEPGGGLSIRVRGGTSANASNEPLFVVDGTPLAVGGGLSAGRNPLNFLNPQDIESVVVLKDASATAIYGSRGANGVVIITTKKGGGGQPQFSYTNSFSTSQVTRRPDLLGADQFRAAVTQYAPGRVALLGNADTDWYGQLERDALGQEHTLALSGSGGEMNYRLSLGYLEQEGVIRGTSTERLSAALNYGHVLFNDRLSMQVSVRGARTEDEFIPGGILGAATAFAPTQPIRLANGQYFEWTGNQLAPNNPLSELALVQDQGSTWRSVGNLETRYKLPFLEGLSATARFGYDMTAVERTEFRPTTTYAEIESGVNRGFFFQRNPSELNTVVDAYGNFVRDLDLWDSNIDATAGWSYETRDRDFAEFQADSLASDLLGINGLPSGSGKVRPSLYVDESKLASFFGRVNWSVMDRYLLTLSVRRDGSSRFGAANEWGTYPAAAVAWRVSEESFMDGLGWI
ncbi:SusC/RagA family TonB-linked outer membrane protein, partial [Longimicrobium sp.]|uniref:SusC/RagA family TonB-linked outer membrane protein n=1 Tax=Longimicrobium sp. TaxID=2029185 RepID=UPI002E344002